MTYLVTMVETTPIITGIIFFLATKSKNSLEQTDYLAMTTKIKVTNKLQVISSLIVTTTKMIIKLIKAEIY